MNKLIFLIILIFYPLIAFSAPYEMDGHTSITIGVTADVEGDDPADPDAIDVSDIAAMCQSGELDAQSEICQDVIYQ